VLEPTEMILWLGRNGYREAALRLAVRCAWGWWIAGERGRGRRLLLDLLADGEQAPAVERTARLWAAALASHEHDERPALADADRVASSGTIDEVDALALVLMADRRAHRGEHDIAARLLGPAQEALRTGGDRWGIALTSLVTARQRLLLGSVDEAEALTVQALDVFHDLPDPAGQLGALDLLGYAAEVRGDWRTAIEQHQRALLLALHGGWPHAQCEQLLRLGSVLVMSGQLAAGRQRLGEALAIARRLDSPSLMAFVRNIAAMADARAGDRAAAEEGHRSALQWYRHTGSTSGVALTAAALARVSPPARAAALLDVSWEAALATRDPRAVAYTAESRALVATGDAAFHLGVADGLRECVGRPRVRGEQPDVDRLADRFAGSDEHGRGVAEGVALAGSLDAISHDDRPCRSPS
jgi:tetratricopeptide (TPR) repeat protein